jgi:hypothetical protein
MFVSVLAFATHAHAIFTLTLLPMGANNTDGIPPGTTETVTLRMSTDKTIKVRLCQYTFEWDPQELSSATVAAHFASWFGAFGMTELSWIMSGNHITIHAYNFSGYTTFYAGTYDIATFSAGLGTPGLMDGADVFLWSQLANPGCSQGDGTYTYLDMRWNVPSLVTGQVNGPDYFVSVHDVPTVALPGSYCLLFSGISLVVVASRRDRQIPGKRGGQIRLPGNE